MNPAAHLLLVLLSLSAIGQNPAVSLAPASNATIDGIVVKDPGSEPVKKVLVELIAENQSATGNHTALTGVDGRFHIESVQPGRYRLFVERTGLLEVEKHHAHPEGRVLTLSPGQELKDVEVRLQAAAVVRGRVVDEDGDPLLNTEVSVMRQAFVAGHSHWEQVVGERTNDLGEYRLAGLPPGSYIVSVNPPPDFKNLIEGTGAAPNGETPKSNPSEKTVATYQTTYYPGTLDRSQAAPVQLHAGDEFPANFALMPSPSLSIRGAVVNLPPRTSAVITLQSRDFNLILNGAEMRKDGSFVIRDVSPGNYTISATVDGAAVPMTARQTVQVGATNIEGLRLTPEPGAWVHGRLRLESKSGGRSDISQMFLALQPVDSDDSAGEIPIGDRFSNVAHVSQDGSFEWRDVPPGNYYVQLVNEGDGNGDWYLQSFASAGHDVNPGTVSVSGGTVAVDVVASADGAVVQGQVLDAKGTPVANAEIVAVPEDRLRGRPDHYRKATSDQNGDFSLRGIPPGDYTLFAWESVDGDAYYSAEFLKKFEGLGVAVRVAEGEHKSATLNVIPVGDEQP